MNCPVCKVQIINPHIHDVGRYEAICFAERLTMIISKDGRMFDKGIRLNGLTHLDEERIEKLLVLI
jgi:hypothetical protein